MRRVCAAAAVVLLSAGVVPGHRLDEYLQGTILTVTRDRVTAEMTLTPGVSVLPLLLGGIDRDGDGALSQVEQRAYVDRILRDLTLRIDGAALRPRLVSAVFPSVAEMAEGRGEIRLRFMADLPPGGRTRRLELENRHESRVAAYQVNGLVPEDRDIRIMAQRRNYSQSFYAVEFEQARRSGWGMPAGAGVLLAVGVVLAARFSMVWLRRGRRPLPAFFKVLQAGVQQLFHAD